MKKHVDYCDKGLFMSNKKINKAMGVQWTKYGCLGALLWMMMGCGAQSGGVSSGDEEATSVEAKRAALASAQKEFGVLRKKIQQLEKELSDAPVVEKSEMVTTFTIQPRFFAHEVTTRGTIQSDKEVTLSASTVAAVETILVKEGQSVKKGQLLVRLDARVVDANISEVKTNLALARLLLTRQENLWNQGIGTEIQYIERQNQVESLSRRLRVFEEQRALTRIRAPFSGLVDEVLAKEGELAAIGTPLLRILNPRDVYARAELSDRFIGRIALGDSVNIELVASGVKIPSRIIHVGRTLNKESRTFFVHAQLPTRGMAYYPHQVVSIIIQDYTNKQALVVPSYLIQSGAKGAYLFRARQENDQWIAERVDVQVGLSYQENTEITQGISSGDQIIDKGYRSVFDRTLISIASANTNP